MMLTQIALIISIVLQFVAAIIALRLTKRTKYRLSWILISAGLLFMAIRRVLEYISFMHPEQAEGLTTFNNWLTVVTSFIITAGVILISELFNYLRRVEKIRQDTEKRVLQAIIETEEKERKRFAKDLHDGLGPLLSTVKMSVSALVQVEEGTKNKDIIATAATGIDESIKSLKEISNNISPHILNNFGLAKAIKNFTAKINDTHAIHISFSTNMPELRFDENKEVILYRVSCELINNTLKHAGAKNIKIRLNKVNNSIYLEYSDDGSGFDIEKALSEKGPGMGLSNMVSRIRSIKGTINIFELIQGGIKAEIKVNIQ